MKLATLLFASALAAGASAVTFDTFDDGAYTVTLTSGNDDHTSPASALGGSRRTYFEVTDNPLNQDSTLTTGRGAFIVSQGAQASTFTNLIYGFGGNLGHVDLSGSKDFQIDFLSSDVVDDITVNIISNGFGGTVSASTPALPNAPYTLHFNLANLNPAVDLSDVTEVRIAFFGRANSDIAIDSIQAVPEPASMVALGLGALGLLRRRSRR